jgi:hypothetical protein
MRMLKSIKHSFSELVGLPHPRVVPLLPGFRFVAARASAAGTNNH